MPQSQPNVEDQCRDFRKMFESLRAEIAKVIVGHQNIVDNVLICLFCGGHVLLEGVPGLGKTLLVRTVQDGGESFYIRGDHRVTLPNLYRLVTER